MPHTLSLYARIPRTLSVHELPALTSGAPDRHLCPLEMSVHELPALKNGAPYRHLCPLEMSVHGFPALTKGAPDHPLDPLEMCVHELPAPTKDAPDPHLCSPEMSVHELPALTKDAPGPHLCPLEMSIHRSRTPCADEGCPGQHAQSAGDNGPDEGCGHRGTVFEKCGYWGTICEGCGHRDTTLPQRLQIRLFWTFYWEIPSLHRIQEIHVGNYLQLEIALSIFNLRGFGSRKGRLLRIR